MTDIAQEIINVSIEDELKQSYLDYAMSVIVGRALPDVRDGLKPVHRRVLYAMRELNNDYNKPYKKSARIVGDVVGKYHPHSDTAAYDTLVRMAQPFSLRYLLVDGQGNFGSVDGDSPAAMRYTEVRMTRLAHALMADLEKETVDFSPNYDESELIPDVLPTRVPNLLINGSSGIAVGMATNIPPHNINEVINACLALIDNPELDLHGLMTHIQGPDFPTAAIINGNAGIIQAYQTGRGRIYVRARTTIETSDNGRDAIIVTELPYQVNKARLMEKIADLVREKKIDGISELRDESDKDGMRMVIALRKGCNAEVLLNQLYTNTQLQTVFGINMVALHDGQPQLLNLKQMLQAFIRHRREVVTRRTHFELRRARQRAHLLEGLGIALVNIDPIVALIKAAKNPAEAKEKLLAQGWAVGIVKDLLQRTGPIDVDDSYGLKQDKYFLSPKQAQAILDLRLHRLTGLEQDKIFEEYKAILNTIAELMAILSSQVKLMRVIREELEEVKQQFGDERRTEIIPGGEILNMEDLIAQEDVAVTLSHQGYIKTQALDTYQAQRRGGKGKSATSMKDEDFVEKLIVANTHDTILCFSTHGRLYWLKTYQIPQASRQSRGRPIVNLLPLSENERINAILPVKEFDKNHYVFMATAGGVVKKVALEHFSRPRSSGIIALNLDEGDTLVGVKITNGQQDVMLFSTAGKVIRFSETAIRPTGRTARGVRGIKLAGAHRVVALIVLLDQENHAILTATENGYGKRTKVSEFRAINRGGQGVIAIQVSDRNGKLVAAKQVNGEEEMMLISNGGTLVRIRVDEVSTIGRNAQGVRLINLKAPEKLVGMETIYDVENAE
ncbi:MAG: DNA gyrase subunit A [Pseudomonadota bacterium]